MGGGAGGPLLFTKSLTFFFLHSLCCCFFLQYFSLISCVSTSDSSDFILSLNICEELVLLTEGSSLCFFPAGLAPVFFKQRCHRTALVVWFQTVFWDDVYTTATASALLCQRSLPQQSWTVNRRGRGDGRFLLGWKTFVSLSQQRQIGFVLGQRSSSSYIGSPLPSLRVRTNQ